MFPDSKLFADAHTDGSVVKTERPQHSKSDRAAGGLPALLERAAKSDTAAAAQRAERRNETRESY
jgi:hypothetical protein